jgi:hypothetical protein
MDGDWRYTFFDSFWTVHLNLVEFVDLCLYPVKKKNTILHRYHWLLTYWHYVYKPRIQALPSSAFIPPSLAFTPPILGCISIVVVAWTTGEQVLHYFQSPGAACQKYNAFRGIVIVIGDVLCKNKIYLGNTRGARIGASLNLVCGSLTCAYLPLPYTCTNLRVVDYLIQ